MTVIVGLLLAASGVHAQQHFPAKPIRMIVPAAPGSALDNVARTLALKLVEAFKQPIVVDNRPGSGGITAAEIAVRAPADGYTVLLVPSTYGASAAFQKLPCDSLNDVTPIALFGVSGFVVALPPSLPVTSIRELITYDKSNPGKLGYGAVGTGSVGETVAGYEAVGWQGLVAPKAVGKDIVAHWNGEINRALQLSDV